MSKQSVQKARANAARKAAAVPPTDAQKQAQRIAYAKTPAAQLADLVVVLTDAGRALVGVLGATHPACASMRSTYRLVDAERLMFEASQAAHGEPTNPDEPPPPTDTDAPGGAL